MTFDAAVAVTISYHVATLGVDGIVGYCLNDQPIPAPISTSFPPNTDRKWLSGMQIVFAFGDLANEDRAILQALNGAIGTLTVQAIAAWIRPRGVFTFSGSTLTLTLSQDIALVPYWPVDPYL